MSFEGQILYPGEAATPRQLLALAIEYRRAADVLRRIGKSGKPLTRSPYRLVAIQAIELYLSAHLRDAGYSAAQLRKKPHNLAAWAELEPVVQLALSKATLAHLKQLTDSREYLISRYDPNPHRMSELTRLEATLNQVAQKVTAGIDPDARYDAVTCHCVAEAPKVHVLASILGAEGL